MNIQKRNSFGAVWLLAVLVAHPLSGQELRATAPARHSIWKVEGAHCTVHLLGSVHLLKKENYPLAAPIEAAFTQAQIAVFEADMDKMQEPETQAKMMNKAQLPPGETLQQHLSAQTYAAFTNRLGKAGLPPAAFDRFKPLIAAAQLEVAMLRDLGAESGLDAYFFARARKDGKQVVALETVDFQIDLFTGFSKEDSESLMKAELKDIDHTEKEFAQLLKAWQTGDSEKLSGLLTQALQESPVMFKRLITDRNQNWLPKIEQLAQGNKPAIVIVGAGHLAGKDGIIELLRKKGLKVTQQ